MALQLVLGHRPDGGAVLLDQAGPPVVRVEAVRTGFALDGQRRPLFVLAADRVTIGAHVHDTLDLSSARSSASFLRPVTRQSPPSISAASCRIPWARWPSTGAW